MMTNTDQLIGFLEAAERTNGGSAEVHFNVGKFTGNGPSVIPALRRRGFNVRICARGGWVLSRESKPL